jgi:hypothetical protein
MTSPFRAFVVNQTPDQGLRPNPSCPSRLGLMALLEWNRLPPFFSEGRRRRHAKRSLELDAGEASTEESLPREQQA